MVHHTEAFVGIDTSKLHNAVAIADSGRGGEVRYLGEFPATEAAIQKLVAKLSSRRRKCMERIDERIKRQVARMVACQPVG